jgi:hypothetical protein
VALSLEQKEQIRILVKSDYKTEANQAGLSNRAIAKQVGCSESAVRTLIKNESLEKNAINALAKREVQNIINTKEIENEKNALKNAEKNAYDKVLLNEVQSLNLALNTNHLLLQKIHENIEAGTKQVVKTEAHGVGMSQATIIDVEHDATDLLNYAKATQTVTDSLGVTNRHASTSATQVNVNTSVQQNNIPLSEEEAKKKALDLGVPLSVLTQ